jgi:hypothetical protein
MSASSLRQYATAHAIERFRHNAGLLELELARGTTERRILLALLELCGLWVERTGPVTLATQPLWDRFGELKARVHAWRPSLMLMVN